MQIRFTVTSEGMRSASWACLGSADSSIYLICRELKSAAKFSLHGSGDWRNAFSAEFLEAETKAGTSRLPPRIMDRWSRPQQIAPGFTLACRILVPRASVTEPFTTLPAKLTAIPAPEFPRAVEVALIITAPDGQVTGWPGRRSMCTELIGSFVLPNGDTVWLVYHTIDGIPAGSHTGTAIFLSGAFEKGKPPYRTRALVYGEEPDGSRTVIEFSLGDEDAAKVYAKARASVDSENDPGATE